MRVFESHTRLILGAILALVPGALPAQGVAVEDLSKTISVSHDGDFFRDRIDVSGTLVNSTRRNFPCVNVIFEVTDGSKRKKAGIKVFDVRGGARKPYSGRLPPGDSVRHFTTLSCPQTKETKRATCTMYGELQSRGDFRAKVKGREKSVVRISLYDKGKALKAVRIRKRGNMATYNFKQVPVGKTFSIAIGEGWLLNGGGYFKAQCRPGETDLKLPGATVSYDHDWDT